MGRISPHTRTRMYIAMFGWVGMALYGKETGRAFEMWVFSILALIAFLVYTFTEDREEVNIDDRRLPRR